jgi:hypothetical protein
MNEECCEKSVEPLSQAITYKFGHIQDMINENSEYIANIHAKLDPVLFDRIPKTSGGKSDEDCPRSDNIWQYFDDTVYILRKQRGEIMSLYERLEG